MEFLDEKSKIKLFLGISDNLQDELIDLLYEDSQERILGYLNGTGELFSEVPDNLSYILRDVAIKRYNKISSEGTSSDSQDGRSISWEDSYLKEYAYILESAIANKKGGRGRARFI